MMAEQFYLFSSKSEYEGRSGAGTFGVPAVSITGPAPFGEYIAPQTGVEEEETLKKVIEILQTIPFRVRAALAQIRQGTGTEEFEGVVLRVDQLVASEATPGTEESEDVLRRVEQLVASEAKRLHSEGLQSMGDNIEADLSAKVTMLIKDMIARLDLFAASESKRLHNEGLQLLAVRIVSDPFNEATKQIKDLIGASAPTPVVENIAPAPGVANLRQNPLRGAMPSGMRHRPSLAEKCETRASRVVAARLGSMWRKSKQVERAACDRRLADMGTVLQYRDELSEIGPVLTRLAGRGDGVVMPSVQHFGSSWRR